MGEVEETGKDSKDEGEKLSNWVKDSKKTLATWRKQAEECYRFVYGDQHSTEEKQSYAEAGRPVITFNRIRPIIESVRGQQITNRRRVSFVPTEPTDAGVTEVIDEIYRHYDQLCDADFHVSDAFLDMIITGVGATEARIDFDESMQGKLITAERVPPLELFWDTDGVARNLADGRFRGRCRYIHIDDAKNMWPKAELSIGGKDDTANYSTHVVDAFDNYAKADKTEGQKYKNHVLVDQIQWRETIPVWLIKHPETGEVVKIYNEPADVPEGVKTAKTTETKYYQAFLDGKNLLEKTEIGISCFTISVMTGSRDNSISSFYGVVRDMLDPQRWSNKFFSDIESVLTTNRQGGAFVEEDALVDMRRAEDQWNSVNPLILVRSGALAQGKIVERSPIPYPAGLDRLLQFSINAVTEISGINMEMLGLADRAQPGVLEIQRKKSAITIISSFFDALLLHSKQRGRVGLKMIQKYLADGRIVRITGRSGDSQYIPIMQDLSFVEFDVVPDETPLTYDKREENFVMFQTLLPMMRELGFSPPPELIDYLPIPASLANRWKQYQPQVQEASQQQAAKEEAVIESEIEHKKSQTVLNVAKAAQIDSAIDQQAIDELAGRNDIQSQGDTK